MADADQTATAQALEGGATWREEPPFDVDAAGHHLTLYPGGRDRLKALLGMIREARSSLRIAFYIFARDASGTQVRDALVAAAARGVAVTIIVDAFGAEADEAFFAPLAQAGGRFECFIAAHSRRYLIRNHQKIVLVDAERAMLGGFNVEDDYFAPPEVNGWSDVGFIVRGPVVARIEAWFDELEDWVTNPRAQFAAIRRKVREWPAGEAPVQLLIGGPTRGLSSWARCVARDLERGERLDMIMAYFSPPPKLIRRIGAIAERGRTRLVMAAKSDNGATIGASRALYAHLLKHQAGIYEFGPSKLHTKLIVLDDAVYLGSANLDMRSLYINLEIVLRIEDAAFAERMRAFVAAHAAASVEVTPALYRSWSKPLTRLRWWTSWFLVAVVDYTVTRRLNLGL
jgi:cardiolipin synthase